jgi:hypothetical protein
MRSKGTCETFFKATLQDAVFARRSALQCRADCGPRKNLRPSSSKHRCGSRSWTNGLQLRARFATETPDSNCYANTNSNSDPKAVADTNSNSNPKAIGDTNTNADPNRNSNIYADVHRDIHSDCHGDFHTYSHGVIHTHSDSDRHSDIHSNPDSNLPGGASRGLFYIRQRAPTLGRRLSQS